MILFVILGLLAGATIPFIAGRFGKIIPADPGLLLLRLYHTPRFPKIDDPMRRYRLHKKWQKLWLASGLWAIFMSILFAACFYLLPSSYVPWGCVFCWIMSISMVIDALYWLLPDFFTIPLLLLGLFFAQQNPQIDIQMALVGALGGYVISALSVMVMGIFSPNPQLGGGDVKMITALGAWLGILGLNYALIISFLLFVIFNALPIQKKGAYGPAIGLASILVFFMMYIK